MRRRRAKFLRLASFSALTKWEAVPFGYSPGDMGWPITQPDALWDRHADTRYRIVEVGVQ